MKRSALTTFLFFFLMLVSIMQASAQSQSNGLGVDIFSAAGGSALSAQGICVSWTVGDIVIDEARNSRKWLSQGFQQGVLGALNPSGNFDTLPPITNIETGKEDIFAVLIYPNPVQNELHYKVISSEIFLYDISLIDFSGKIIWTEKNKNGENDYTLSMTNLPSGMYFLRIYFPLYRTLKAYKIIKQ